MSFRDAPTPRLCASGQRKIAPATLALLLSTTLLSACGGGSGTAAPSSSSPVLVPTSSSPTVPVADPVVTPAPTPTPVATTPVTLSDFLASPAGKAAAADTQGQFLQSVADQMRQNGLTTDASLLAAPQLSVSADKRYLQSADGKPFLFMADTAWMWLYRLSATERQQYIATRKDQGFNVLLFQFLTGGYGEKDVTGNAIFNGSGIAYGPDLTRAPNARFWANARRSIEDISRAGMVPAIVLTWGAHVQKGLFDKQSAYDFGRLVGRAFGDLNILWVLGGDTVPTDADKILWEAMAQGVRDGEPHRNLMTFHPARGSSADYFPTSSWLDIDSLQSGHARWRPRAVGIGPVIYDRYVLNRGMPLVDLESGYERIVDSLYNTEPDVTKTVSEDKRLDSYDIRVRVYQQWLSGAMGYGYGEIDTITSWRTGMAPYWPVNQNWWDGQQVEGAGQLRYFQQLRSEIGEAAMTPVPEWSKIKVTILDYFRTVTACNGARSICVAYDADGSVVNIPVDQGRFKGCSWMNPRTGARSSCSGTAAKGGGLDYTPPVVSGTPVAVDGVFARTKNDWLLILKN